MERNKLLIADGSSLSRSILKRIFEKDFVVLQAENGRDAFELFREQEAAKRPAFGSLYLEEWVSFP